jgi:hypothetical protein
MPPITGVPGELRELVNALRGVYDNGPSTLSPDVAKDIAINSGMQPYDLAPYVTFLFPVFSPLRNKMPRWVRQGKNFEFKAVTNPDTNNVSGIAQEGVLSPAIQTQFADVTAYFQPYGVSSDPVTYEQIFAGEGRRGDFSVDSRSLAIAQLLKAMFIKEERLLWFAQGATTQVVTVNNAPVNGLTYTVGGGMGNAPAPTLALASGGTIPTGSPVYAAVCGVSGMGVVLGMPTVGGRLYPAYNMPGQSLPTAAGSMPTVTPTTGNQSIVVSPPNYTGPVPIVGWTVFVGTSTTTVYYAGFTTGAPITITSLPASTAGSPPTTDGTYSSGAFNSVASYIWATNSNSTVRLLNGPLTSANTVNGVLVDVWNNAQGDPDTMYTSGADMPALTAISIGSGNPYFLTYRGTPAEQTDVIGNYRVSRWINPVTSKVLPINVHAYMPQGSIYFLTEQLPAWFVGNDVPSVFAWTGSMDYLQIDYAPTPATPKFLSEIRCYGAPVCFLPSQHAVIAGITQATYE